MSNWDIMLSGKMYNDFSEDLFQRRIRAKKLFRTYNKTDDDEVEKRGAILKQLFERVGSNVWIETGFRCEFGSNISIGDNVYINFDCIILDCAKVTIGDDVLMGPRIGLYAADHAIDPAERANGGCIGRPITIGNKVWIGGDVKVISGVTIGDGSVIGAGSVVTKDIPAGVIAAGSPCRVIRPITEQDKAGFVPVLD